MAVIQRITDFIPNTLIVSQEVDDEFNQLVNLLSGVSTGVDTLLKFSDAANPVLRVDQLGAGVIAQFLQNGAVKTTIDNSGHLYIGEGVTDATPAAGRINGTGGSGTNIAGANLELAGGKGTGNGAQGQAVIKYPLGGASGTTLQSLSSNPYPIETSQYLDSNSSTTVANTTTETALLGAAEDSSTKTIEAGLARVGRTFRLVFRGTIANTGTPTLTLRLKLGSTTLQTYTGGMVAIGTTSTWRLELHATIAAIGAGGSITIHPGTFEYAAVIGAAVSNQWLGLTGSATVAVDFSAAQTWELTVQWGTASASNTITYMFGNIDILR